MTTARPRRDALRLLALFALGLLLPSPGSAACMDREISAASFTICEASPTDDLRIFQTAPDGAPFGTFDAVQSALEPQGLTLGFAMNAGMYQPDRAPVGLMIEEGVERARIVTSAGPGNFGLLPNGVFCISDRFAVIESRAFARHPPDCRYATQSGPMLVIDGAIHPRFMADSPSRYIRNGVGVSADGRRAYFVISDRPVNFTEFARVFRDTLKTPNALYFDGNVSRLYAPDLGRRDPGFPMGPIVGLVRPAG